jgi:hypothetical protein
VTDYWFYGSWELVTFQIFYQEIIENLRGSKFNFLKPKNSKFNPQKKLPSVQLNYSPNYHQIFSSRTQLLKIGQFRLPKPKIFYGKPKFAIGITENNNFQVRDWFIIRKKKKHHIITAKNLSRLNGRPQIWLPKVVLIGAAFLGPKKSFRVVSVELP